MSILRPDASRLFTRVQPDGSDVPLYVLTERVAPLQQGFYFVNSSTDDDGRWLWFYCAWPPSGSGAAGRCLGVVDVEQDALRVYPESCFTHAAPYVAPETGVAYWGNGKRLYRRGPGARDDVGLVGELPADLVRARAVPRFATHLTRSADGREFFVDAAVGTHHVFGSMRIADGAYEHWHTFSRNHNHAQFSPTDPDTVLFAQENHTDAHTGLRIGITDRLHVIRRGEAPRPVFPRPTVCTHEWWAPGGAHAYAIKGGLGIWKVELATAETEEIPLAGAWHAHSSRDEKYLVADATRHFYRGCASSVHFLNRETGRKAQVVSNPEMRGQVGSDYHIDPHPRFVAGDEWVVFTTTINGVVDLALARVADLVGATS